VRSAIAAAIVVALWVAADGLGLFRPSAGRVVGDLGRGHVPDGQPVRYNSLPPTSGPHWAAPAAWGSYSERVPDERIVHNLEHGGIAIAYHGIDQPAVQKLRGLLTTFPRDRFGRVKLVIHPDDRLETGTIALTAWTRLELLREPDEARIRRFYDAHLGRCCEQVP